MNKTHLNVNKNLNEVRQFNFSKLNDPRLMPNESSNQLNISNFFLITNFKFIN